MFEWRQGIFQRSLKRLPRIDQCAKWSVAESAQFVAGQFHLGGSEPTLVGPSSRWFSADGARRRAAPQHGERGAHIAQTHRVLRAAAMTTWRQPSRQLEVSHSNPALRRRFDNVTTPACALKATGMNTMRIMAASGASQWVRL
jgi:hypothetical protein